MNHETPWCGYSTLPFLLALSFLGAPLGAATSNNQILGLAGKCLSVENGSTAEGAAVVLASCAAGAAQRWELSARGFSAEILGLEDKCLDVRGGVAEDGALAELRSCDGGPTQQWRFGQDGRIVGDGGWCLGALAASSAEATPIVLGACRGRIEQLWRPRSENRFTWTSLAGGSLVSGLWLDPAGSGIALATVAEVGPFRSEDGGESWSPLPAPLGDRLGLAAVASPLDPQVVYTRDSYSRDGGQSWHAIQGLRFSTRDIAPSQRDAHEVFALDALGRVYRSRNTGERWVKRGRLPARDVSFGRLVAHPLEPGTLFASTSVSCDFGPCGQTTFTLRSTDDGRRWQQVRAAAPFVFFQLAFDPVDPSWVYAMTDTGLMRSSDGGESWSAANPPAAGPEFAGALVVDPERPDRLLISNGRRLYTSLDRGATWSSRALPFPASGTLALLGHAPGDSRLYGALWLHPADADAEHAGLYVSKNAGASWRRIGRGLSAVDVVQVLPAPVAGAPVHALGPAGLFASADGGTSWRQLLGGYRRAAAVDPANPDHLLVSDDRGKILRSDDGGASFVRSRQGIEPGAEVEVLIFRPQTPGTAFAFSSNPYRIYRSSDGGASWRTVLELPFVFLPMMSSNADGSRVFFASDETGLWTSSDGGDSWQNQPSSVWKLACDRVDPAQVWLVTSDGLMLSEDRGASFRSVAWPPGIEVYYMVESLDAARGNLVLTSFLGDVWRSSDRGASWTRLEIGLPGDFFDAAASADPVVPERVWLAVQGYGVLVGDFTN